MTNKENNWIWWEKLRSFFFVGQVSAADQIIVVWILGSTHQKSFCESFILTSTESRSCTSLYYSSPEDSKRKRENQRTKMNSSQSVQEQTKIKKELAGLVLVGSEGSIGFSQSGGGKLGLHPSENPLSIRITARPPTQDSLPRETKRKRNQG